MDAELSNRVERSTSPGGFEETDQVITIGQFEIFNNFQIGVELSCSLEGDRLASISFLPSEALAFAALVEQHRDELEEARIRERSLPGAAPVSVVDPAGGPAPIPTVQHLHGDVWSETPKPIAPEHTTDT